MDQNITDLMAANVTIFQPWYALIINASIGPISALIGAGAVYFTSRRAAKYEGFRALREERKKSYIKLVYSYLLILSKINRKLPLDGSDFDRFSRCLAEIKLIGSPEIINEISKSTFDIATKEGIKKELDKLIPIMANDLQDIDVYKIIDDLN